MTRQLTIEQFEGQEEMLVDLYEDETSNKKIVKVGSREHLLNLQLVMATTSVNHEYARMEYEETIDMERKEELMNFMGECRQKYEDAREELSNLNPLILETFENELVIQKKTTMVHYHA